MSPFFATFASRWRLLAVLVVVAALAATMYYRSLPQVLPLVPAGVLPQINIPSSPGKPVMPKGYQPELAVRDPFAAPPEFQPKMTLPGPAPAASAASGGREIRQKEIMPVLTGIIMAGNIGSAIIQYGADSRSYRRGDYVGPYVVAAISSNSVTLQGPGGRLTLGVGK